jgi:hypothetical protein
MFKIEGNTKTGKIIKGLLRRIDDDEIDTPNPEPEADQEQWNDVVEEEH